MGAVYRGVSLNVDRAVAIKVMHTSLPGEMAARERFQREAKLMALVDHPHCISVIDYGLHQGRPYLVMDLVRGRSLYALLAEQQQVESARAIDIIRQVLSGLAYAHEQGIIHRDIKPANIMVTPKAPLGVHVRILDFGLARLRESSTSLTGGLAVGTPSYMAPEQCRGDAVDARVDIYACGIVLFEMLAGRKPFVSSDLLEVVKQQMHQVATAAPRGDQRRRVRRTRKRGLSRSREVSRGSISDRDRDVGGARRCGARPSNAGSDRGIRRGHRLQCDRAAR